MKKITDLYASFRRLTVPTQIWMMLVLAPANFLTLALVDGPLGFIIPLLSMLGFIPNLGIAWVQNGFSAAMALPHLVFWTPQVLILGAYFAQTPANSSFTHIAYALIFVVNSISLLFDIRETAKWFGGQKSIA
ncbi:hypothetical protein SAMN02745824_1707 [Parasphingorhabdus marina DSM 22363]|uniref:Uncharacterized protein n=1 Tax=Parasphingorhabdus marina DSM 22363 TaxID=1123272 RepID=A0A1N6D8W5_9SPHN|nr:hypothetical protein [Parasphingorhabdus marina]SIN67242.1 hypothetical protein SAMN02745824_1707 [Parasphingorhabdus marina DSM 22363]